MLSECHKYFRLLLVYLFCHTFFFSLPKSFPLDFPIAEPFHELVRFLMGKSFLLVDCTGFVAFLFLLELMLLFFTRLIFPFAPLDDLPPLPCQRKSKQAVSKGSLQHFAHHCNHFRPPDCVSNVTSLSMQLQNQAQKKDVLL